MTKNSEHDSLSVHALLAQAHRLWSARFIGALRDGGFADVTPAFAALMPLIEPPGIRQSDIARRAGLSKQAVGQLVRELALRDYVKLKPDPSDTRASLVTFTKRGMALRKRGFEIKAEQHAAFEQWLGADETKKLTAGLRSLVVAMEAEAVHRDPVRRRIVPT